MLAPIIVTWGTFLLNAQLICRMCEVHLPPLHLFAYVAGVVGEYSKDALLDGGNKQLPLSNFLLSIGITSIVAISRPRVVLDCILMLLVTAFYAVPIPGTRNLCMKTAFPCSKNFFVPLVHVLWLWLMADLTPAHPAYWESAAKLFSTQMLMTCLFDLKDVDADQKKQVTTIATMFGREVAAVLIAFASACCIALTWVWSSSTGGAAASCIIYVAICVWSVGALWYDDYAVPRPLFMQTVACSAAFIILAAGGGTGL
jgi:4-hydroxybenzoate polyprenyltransferase